MAYCLSKTGKPDLGYPINSEGAYHEYICDTAADVATLPTTGLTNMEKPRPGSRALVTGTAEVYVLSLARSWVKIPDCIVLTL